MSDRHQDPLGSTFGLLPKLKSAEFSKSQLEQLAKLMTTNQTRLSDIPAGYTYFGQFIAHDISKVSRPDQEVDAFSPYPSLELDSVYGRGICDLDTSIEPDTGLFSIGETSSGRLLDLPRDSEGRAVIADARNDENAIISQFHVQWMKYHNNLVSRSEDRSPEARFEFARQATIATYQETVLNSFLRVFTSDLVYEKVVDDKKRFLEYPRTPPDEAVVPLEFAAAAFRFGHSMVVPFYDLNAETTVTTEKLLRMTGRLGMGEHHRLPDSWVIDWRKFFRIDGATSVNRAFSIDPRIISELKSLGDNPAHLALRNLSSGNRLGLPSGQALARVVCQTAHEEIEVRVFESIDDFFDAKYFEPHLKQLERAVLSEHCLYESTPLWYYLLAEDWMEHPQDTGRGQKLGTLGGILVAETLVRLIESSSFSICSSEGRAVLDRVKTEFFHGLDVTIENLLMLQGE